MTKKTVVNTLSATALKICFITSYHGTHLQKKILISFMDIFINDNNKRNSISKDVAKSFFLKKSNFTMLKGRFN